MPVHPIGAERVFVEHRGLLAGFVVPALGIAAAAGLVLYFTGALAAHLRVHDRHFGKGALFFVLAVAALAVNLAYHVL